MRSFEAQVLSASKSYDYGGSGHWMEGMFHPESSEKSAHITYREKGCNPEGKWKFLYEEDIEQAVKQIVSGEAPVSEEWVEKVRAAQDAYPDRTVIPKQIADTIVQIAVFGEIIYWGHRPQEALPYMFVWAHTQQPEG